MQALILHWRAILGGLMLAYIAVLHLNLEMEKRSAAKWQRAALDEQAAHKQTVKNYREAAERARLADLANKHRVEADYARIQSEKTNVQKELAATRARLDSLRLREPSGTHTRSPGAKDMPGTPGTPGGAAQPGGATVMDETDKLICEINTLTAEGWREWYDRVRAVPR